VAEDSGAPGLFLATVSRGERQIAAAAQVAGGQGGAGQIAEGGQQVVGAHQLRPRQLRRHVALPAPHQRSRDYFLVHVGGVGSRRGIPQAVAAQQRATGGSEDDQGSIEQGFFGKPGEERRHIVIEGRNGGRGQALVEGERAQQFLIAGGIPGRRFLTEGGELDLGIEVAVLARHAVVGGRR